MEVRQAGSRYRGLTHAEGERFNGEEKVGTGLWLHKNAESRGWEERVEATEEGEKVVCESREG